MAATGKWIEPGVPHKGWRWIDSNDLEADRMICEMCESTEIRYVHYAEHDDWPETLAVGCVCIEHMTDDYVGPRRHEKEMRSSVKRRAAFPDRKRWRVSRKGNPNIDLDDYRVVLKQRGGIWRVSINPPGTSKWVDGRKEFTSKRKAMLSAFDGVMWLKKRV